MANLRKYTKQNAYNVIRHQERTCASYANKDIDPEKTPLNYCVWPYESPDKVGESHGWERLMTRINSLPISPRKDAIYLVEWTLHLAPDVPPGYDSEKEFFTACMRYCALRYGEKNILYGIVHKDEHTPHLSVGFVPIVTRVLVPSSSPVLKSRYEKLLLAGNTTIDCLCVSDIINRKHLQDWHGDLTAFLIKELGYNPAVYTGITKYLGGDISVSKLKSKPRNWRIARNKQVEEYHNVRRSKSSESKAKLDDLINVSNPNRSKPQADCNIPSKNQSLNNQILSATNRLMKK